MNLYELKEQAIYLVELLESGEIDEQTYTDTLESIGTDIAVDDIIKAIKNAEADVEAYKNESNRLKEKQLAAENKVKRLKKTLLDYMSITNQSKIKTSLFATHIGHAQSVEINGDVPMQYLIPQPPKVDKKALADDLKKGMRIPDIKLVQSSHIVIK